MRAAIAYVSYEALGAMLQLPAEATVIAANYEPERGSLSIVISSPELPDSPPAGILPLASATIGRGADGEVEIEWRLPGERP